MPRLTARRRLKIMSAALATAEDRQASGESGVPLGELANEIGVEIEDLKASLDPLRWVEMRVPGGLVDLLDGIMLTPHRLIVHDGWWRHLAAITPAEAARLYVRAAAAAALGTAESAALRTAMRKLRRIVGAVTVVEGERPRTVEDLREARQSGDLVVIYLAGRFTSLITPGSYFGVLAVYRDRDEWMTVLYSPAGNSTLGIGAGEAATIPVSQLVSLNLDRTVPAPETEMPSSVMTAEPRFTVTIEYPEDTSWLLDPYDLTDEAKPSPGMRRATFRVWGTPELRTLLLRMGPQARILAPVEMEDLQAETARRILDLYG